MKEVRQFFGRAHNAHAASAAAGLGFENDGVTDLRRNRNRIIGVRNHAVGARQDRHLGLLHCLARFFFFAHQPRDLGRRSDELDVRRAAHLGKVGVLAQQPIPRMDRIDVGDLSRGDNGRHVEIAVRGPRWPNADGFVGKADMERVPVCLRVDRDGADAELAAGVDDAQRNLAAIGNQDLTKHAIPSRAVAAALDRPPRKLAMPS